MSLTTAGAGAWALATVPAKAVAMAASAIARLEWIMTSSTVKADHQPPACGHHGASSCQALSGIFPIQTLENDPAGPRRPAAGLLRGFLVRCLYRVYGRFLRQMPDWCGKQRR
jgi:hypothetical protein